MGIKNLHDFFRSKIPNVYQIKNLSELKGTKFAIDTSIFMCKYKNTYGNGWLEGFYQLIMTLLKNDIDFIFIFDSKPPPEKEEEREQRSIARQKNNDRIKEIIKNWEDFLEKEKDKNEYLLEDFKEFSNLYSFLEKKKEKTTFLKSEIISYLQKLEKNMIPILPEYFQLLRELLRLMNISFYDADSEAEGTCSLMARKGLVDGVLTEDTDVMAYGTPLMFFNLNLQNETVSVLSLQDVLKELEITFEHLQDFCIMCGTDYNSNMKNIGSKKSFKLVQTYGSLENISKHYDTSILNYERGRTLFHCEQYELKIDTFHLKEEIQIDTLPLQEFCFYHNIPFQRKESSESLLTSI